MLEHNAPGDGRDFALDAVGLARRVKQRALVARAQGAEHRQRERHWETAQGRRYNRELGARALEGRSTATYDNARGANDLTSGRTLAAATEERDYVPSAQRQKMTKIVAKGSAELEPAHRKARRRLGTKVERDRVGG